MIKDFLIINFTGKNDTLGLKINNSFFTQKFQTNTLNNEILVKHIIEFLKEKGVNIDKNFSIIVNRGPGSFSSIRVALAVAKGINISKGSRLYGYKDSQLDRFSLKNIELLIDKKLLQNKLIKPLYIS